MGSRGSQGGRAGAVGAPACTLSRAKECVDETDPGAPKDSRTNQACTRSHPIYSRTGTKCAARAGGGRGQRPRRMCPRGRRAPRPVPPAAGRADSSPHSLAHRSTLCRASKCSQSKGESMINTMEKALGRGGVGCVPPCGAASASAAERFAVMAAAGGRGGAGRGVPACCRRRPSLGIERMTVEPSDLLPARPRLPPAKAGASRCSAHGAARRESRPRPPAAPTAGPPPLPPLTVRARQPLGPRPPTAH